MFKKTKFKCPLSASLKSPKTFCCWGIKIWLAILGAVFWPQPAREIGILQAYMHAWKRQTVLRSIPLSKSAMMQWTWAPVTLEVSSQARYSGPVTLDAMLRLHTVLLATAPAASFVESGLHRAQTWSHLQVQFHSSWITATESPSLTKTLWGYDNVTYLRL